ncbi:MAG: peptidase T [Firmicutes bacterium HGW-Firmicutes-20]|jgi:tripeptide aminopeptidase|nr:MAG: peptidase T [Firmicutes bacterium HGW-Firmicutes-20]
METMLERLIRYCKVNTRSDETSKTVPSTQAQVEFAKMLAEELVELGFSEVIHRLDNGFVIATIPSNIERPVDTIGFIAHFDTADFNSEDIQPQIIENYDGEDILLNKPLDVVMSVDKFPNLRNYVGHTLVTTDGTTLLGADDKAGIVEIIDAMLYFINHPEEKHGEIRVAFGPDEEIGRGANLFDAKDFRAKYAYTLDGSVLGELEYESFNAAAAKVTLHGVSVHPGTAKDKMINTAKLAFEFDSMLPQDEVPEKTEGYQGFFLLNEMKTTIELGHMNYIIRDHDKQKFLSRKQLMLDNAEAINEKYGATRVVIDMSDSYYNMAEIITKDFKPVELAKQAMENVGVQPLIKPIRGGTDGSKISFMGIPTPNLFTGAENFHGKFEFASKEVMEKAVSVIIEIVKLNAK